MTMNQKVKRVEALTIADLEEFPVWQYTNSDTVSGETFVRPIKRLPVKSLNGRVVGTNVLLANGFRQWALIGNVDVADARLTQHFLTLSVLRDKKWFTMARYHDIDRLERGPVALANFLGLPSNQVFPITYDITGFCVGEYAALANFIGMEPKEKLTRSQIIALAVP